MALLHVGIWCLGAALLTAGLLGLTMSDVVHSEANLADAHSLRMADAGLVGYGLVLLLHWRILANVPWLALVLVVMTLATLGAALLMSRTDQALVLRMAKLAIGLLPMAVALAFVVSEYRDRANALEAKSMRPQRGSRSMVR
tara:strand:+ start:4435 stop:4860 length:426 start_codon:yes stop_codon:yes gene_type:complete